MGCRIALRPMRFTDSVYHRWYCGPFKLGTIAEDYSELDLMMQVSVSSPTFLCTSLFVFDLYIFTYLTFVEEMAPHTALCSILGLKHSSVK